MKALRLFSITTKVLIGVAFVLSSAGCSSGQRKSEVVDGPGFDAETRTPWSPNPAVSKIAQKNVQKEIDQDQLAEQVFSYYCRSGHQIHQLSVSGNIFLGREKSGIPLDQAEHNRANQHQNAEDYIKQLFSYHRDVPSHFSNWESHPNVHLITRLKKESDVINYGRYESIPCTASATSETSQFQKFSCQTFLVQFDGSNSVLLYAGDLPLSVVTWNRDSKPEAFRDSMYYASNDHREFPFAFGFIQITQSQGPHRVVKSLDFLEPRLFGDKFVIMNSHDFSKTIENRHKTWNDYVAGHTTLKLANTDVADVRTFESSLDLEPYCQSAKLVQDLQSK